MSTGTGLIVGGADRFEAQAESNEARLFALAASGKWESLYGALAGRADGLVDGTSGARIQRQPIGGPVLRASLFGAMSRPLGGGGGLEVKTTGGSGTLRIGSIRVTWPTPAGRGGMARPSLELARESDGSYPAPPGLETLIKGSPGQPLDPSLRSAMESAFHADLSRVRVHTDGSAQDASRAIGARAFTTGSDVFFNVGQYDPNSARGKALIGHELTHVLQQSMGAAQVRLSPLGHGGAIQAASAQRAADHDLTVRRKHGTVGNVARPKTIRGKGASGNVPADFEQLLARSASSSLPAEVASRLGSWLGADFSGVRVHTDTPAAMAAGAIGAEAFAIGRDIFFGKGRYDPHSARGVALIGHELTHVAQDAGGSATVDLRRKEGKVTNPVATTEDRDLADIELATLSWQFRRAYQERWFIRKDQQDDFSGNGSELFNFARSIIGRKEVYGGCRNFAADTFETLRDVRPRYHKLEHIKGWKLTGAPHQVTRVTNLVTGEQTVFDMWSIGGGWAYGGQDDKPDWNKAIYPYSDFAFQHGVSVERAHQETKESAWHHYRYGGRQHGEPYNLRKPVLLKSLNVAGHDRLEDQAIHNEKAIYSAITSGHRARGRRGPRLAAASAGLRTAAGSWGHTLRRQTAGAAGAPIGLTSGIRAKDVKTIPDLVAFVEALEQKYPTTGFEIARAMRQYFYSDFSSPDLTTAFKNNDPIFDRFLLKEGGLYDPSLSGMVRDLKGLPSNIVDGDGDKIDLSHLLVGVDCYRNIALGKESRLSPIWGTKSMMLTHAGDLWQVGMAGLIGVKNLSWEEIKNAPNFGSARELRGNQQGLRIGSLMGPTQSFSGRLREFYDLPPAASPRGGANLLRHWGNVLFKDNDETQGGLARAELLDEPIGDRWWSRHIVGGWGVTRALGTFFGSQILGKGSGFEAIRGEVPAEAIAKLKLTLATRYKLITPEIIFTEARKLLKSNYEALQLSFAFVCDTYDAPYQQLPGIAANVPVHDKYEHYFACALIAYKSNRVGGEVVGWLKEVGDYFGTGFDKDDIRADDLGAAFGGRLRKARTDVLLDDDAQARRARRELSLDLLDEPGLPLEMALREKLEQEIGADLSSVRLLTGQRAEAMANAIGAEAFTIGHRIFMGAGAYNPETPEGMGTLVHEATHVVQAQQGRLIGPATPSRTANLEAEAHGRERAFLGGTSSAAKSTTRGPSQRAVAAPAPAPELTLREAPREAAIPAPVAEVAAPSRPGRVLKKAKELAGDPVRQVMTQWSVGEISREEFLENCAEQVLALMRDEIELAAERGESLAWSKDLPQA